MVDLLRSCRGFICLGDSRGGGVVVHGPAPQDLDLHGAREQNSSRIQSRIGMLCLRGIYKQWVATDTGMRVR